jgi:hypothetical protein
LGHADDFLTGKPFGTKKGALNHYSDIIGLQYDDSTNKIVLLYSEMLMVVWEFENDGQIEGGKKIPH